MWSALNNSYLTPLCLLFPSRILALALLMHRLSLREADELVFKHLPQCTSWSQAFPKADKKEVEEALKFLNSHAEYFEK